VPIEQMERRVFGCQTFSDTVFKTSLCVVEKVLERILNEFQDDDSDSDQVLKVGFYANEKTRLVEILVEEFD
jgi:hypothetical protein